MRGVELWQPLHKLLLIVAYFDSIQPHLVKLPPHMPDLTQSILKVSTSNFVLLFDRLKLDFGPALDLFVCSDSHVHLLLQQ